MYASMQLEGTAYNWYMWWKKSVRGTSWDLFNDDFFKRFHGIKDEDFFTELMRLRQKGNVDEYTQEWETLATRVPGISNMRLVKSYVTGLKPYIQNELDLHEIGDMETTIQKARDAEKKLESSSFFYKGNSQ